jgi:Nodulin-like
VTLVTVVVCSTNGAVQCSALALLAWPSGQDVSAMRPQVVTLAIVGLSGSGWVDTAAIVTSVRNFPRHRGSVVGETPTHEVLPTSPAGLNV